MRTGQTYSFPPRNTLSRSPFDLSLALGYNPVASALRIGVVLGAVPTGLGLRGGLRWPSPLTLHAVLRRFRCDGGFIGDFIVIRALGVTVDKI